MDRLAGDVDLLPCREVRQSVGETSVCGTHTHGRWVSKLMTYLVG